MLIAPVLPYSSSSYTPSYDTSSRAYSTPSTTRARPTYNRSRSSSTRRDRSRYHSSYDSYAMDSEDDDFIDNRDFNELSEHSR